MANVISQSVQDIITPFPINSDSAFVVLSNLNVQAELIYIDAGHEYDCVLRDIQNYWKLLTNDGCMVLDDFNSWPGVTQAVMEFCALNKLVPLTDDRKAVIFKSKPTSLRNLINYQP